MAGLAGLDRQSDRQMGLAGSRGAEEADVGVLVHPAELGQVHEQRSLRCRLGFEVEVLDRLVGREGCVADPVARAGGIAGEDLGFEFVDPHFPGKDGAVEYALGMLLGFALVGLVFFGTWRYVIHRLEPECAGRWRVYPTYILVAAVLVMMARLASFLPGFVLGTVAEYEPSRKLSTRTAGIRVLSTYGILALIGLVAWVAWIPVTEAADHAGASSLILVLDAMLAVTFVVALETVAFGLLPMTFLDGHYLYEWKPKLWAALWGGSLLWLATVIVNPALGDNGHMSGATLIGLTLLFSALMLVAVTTWGYFRVREARLARAATGPS